MINVPRIVLFIAACYCIAVWSGARALHSQTAQRCIIQPDGPHKGDLYCQQPPTEQIGYTNDELEGRPVYMPGIARVQ